MSEPVARVRFEGRILPTIPELSIDDHPGVKWFVSELELTITIHVQIKNSSVTISCDIDKPFDSESHLLPIAMRAYDAARATVDLIIFSTGAGLTLIIDQFVDHGGKTTVFLPKDPSLVALASAAPVQKFGEVLPIVLTDPQLFLALRDLTEALTQFHQAPISCARAVDGLRARFVPAGGVKEDGWPILRQMLRVERSYIDPIMNISRGPRHGDRSRISGNVTRDITQRSWTLMNRFIAYRLRGGSDPLPESEFPILS